MQANKLLKGDVIRITGSVNSDGVIWWVAPGKQPVRVAAVEPGNPVVLGPYLNDVQYAITMNVGAYIIENIGRDADYIPIPLADFMEGGGGIPGDGGVESIVALSQTEYDALEPKNSTTLYVIVG